MSHAAGTGFLNSAQGLGGQLPPGKEEKSGLGPAVAESLEHDLADGEVAAMAVENNQLPEAMVQDGLDNIGDIALQGFVAHGQRTRKTHVMRGTADFDRGQDQHIPVHRRVEALEEIATDKRVGLQR